MSEAAQSLTEIKRVPESQWKWFGNAGHFICASWCRFHLCTKAGNYLVSTIGEYVPDAPVREIHCETSGIVLEGRGDARLADYMKKVGFQPLGGGPHPYETLVFKAGKECDCGCGMPIPEDWNERDGRRWMTAAEATIGHLTFCDKYAEEQKP